MRLEHLRVAIVHDWLVTYAGAERVLEQMLAVFPQADLYSLIDFLPADKRDFIGNRPVTTSWLQKIPRARRYYRNYLPLMPLAIEQFDLSQYDLVLSSSHAIAKGVLTSPDQLHVCMCYSPMRYAWDLQHQYLRESQLEHGPKSWLARLMLHRIRLWDVRTANGVDHFIAISDFIARRIHKVYRRGSVVIYPPVDTDAFTLATHKEDFYLTASRLVPYKRIDLIVKAFRQMPDKRLVVIGSGPEAKRIAALAGPNVTLLGYQSTPVLREHMRRAKAFVFAAEEDFGIVTVEAQACGTAVIAYGKGGSRETVRPLGTDPQTPTGIFFDRQETASLQDAVHRFEAAQERFRPAAIRNHSERFGQHRFRDELRGQIELWWDAFVSRDRVGRPGAASLTNDPCTPLRHATSSDYPQETEDNTQNDDTHATPPHIEQEKW